MRIRGRDGSSHLVAPVLLWLSLAGQKQEEAQKNYFFFSWYDQRGAWPKMLFSPLVHQ